MHFSVLFSLYCTFYYKILLLSIINLNTPILLSLSHCHDPAEHRKIPSFHSIQIQDRVSEFHVSNPMQEIQNRPRGSCTCLADITLFFQGIPRPSNTWHFMKHPVRIYN